LAGNLTNATAIGNGAIVNASNKVRLVNTAVTVISRVAESEVTTLPAMRINIPLFFALVLLPLAADKGTPAPPKVRPQCYAYPPRFLSNIEQNFKRFPCYCCARRIGIAALEKVKSKPTFAAGFAGSVAS
jgi:hypothetical protein